MKPPNSVGEFQLKIISSEVWISLHVFVNMLTPLFHIEYKIVLKFPNSPLVDVGGQKSNLLPPEVCDILPNQPYRGKLTDEHTAQMILVAANPPNINANAIVGRGLDELGYKQGAAPLGAFGISISSEMTVVPGRILAPPGIKYAVGTPDVNDKASWNLRNVKFAKGARLENWAVLVIKDGNDRDEFSNPNDPALLDTIKGFAETCGKSGMSVDKNPPLILGVGLPPKDRADPTRAGAIKSIRDVLTAVKKKPTLIMVILSNGDKHVYSGIKHLCDSYLDVGELKFLYILLKSAYDPL